VLDIIFSAYTMFLMYPHRKKSNERFPDAWIGRGGPIPWPP